LLAREAVTSVYLFAVIVLSRKEELMEIEPNDMDMMHFTLSKLPQSLDLDALIEKTVQLYAQHPPATLPFRVWRRISANSVLKTTANRAALTNQTLEDGEMWLDKQAKELARQKAWDERVKHVKLKMWMYRRPALFGVAVAVGIIGLYLGRTKGADRLWISGVPGLKVFAGLFDR
jgi:hypothetical protein